MRKAGIGIVVFIVCLLGYMAWPLSDLYRLVHAIETRDIATVTRRVDFPAVRRSVARQLEDTYWRLKGQTPPQGGLAMIMGPSIAEAMVARVVTPEALTQLLQQGWPVNVVPDRPAGFVGLSWQTLGTIGQLFVNSDYGIGRFDVSVPANVDRQYQFGLQFRLHPWRWQLSGIDLPEPIQVRLTQELIKTLERK